jgi:nitric oxide synthase-interacting protein
MKRQTLLLQQMRNNEADELASARASARERVLREFEATQSGLSSKGTVGKVVAGTAVDKDAGERGTKRKFDLDQEEIDRLTKEGEDEALRRTALEMIESRRAKLPNFWLVSGHHYY